MYALISTIISSYDSAEIIEINQNLTALRSNTYCYILQATATV